MKPGAPPTALGMKERDDDSRAGSGNKASNKSQVQDPEDGEVRFSSDGEFRYYTEPIIKVKKRLVLELLTSNCCVQTKDFEDVKEQQFN